MALKDYLIVYISEDREDRDELSSVLKEPFNFRCLASLSELNGFDERIQFIILDADLLTDDTPEKIVNRNDRLKEAYLIAAGSFDDIHFLSEILNKGIVRGIIPKPFDAGHIRKDVRRWIQHLSNLNNRNDLIDDVHTLYRDMHYLHKVSQQISEMKTLENVLRDIIEKSKLVVNADKSSLLLYDEDDGKLHFYRKDGEGSRYLSEHPLEIGEGVAGWVAEHKKPVIIDDCYEDERFEKMYDEKTNYKTRNMICVPLLIKDRLVGVMQALNKKDEDRFNGKDLILFETLASQCAIAIDNSRLFEAQIKSKTLEREVETAREIHRKILPINLPEYDDIDPAAIVIDAMKVGGDYYNMIRIDEDTSLITIADVTGKSIPAALIVSVIDATLATYLDLKEDANELLSLVNCMNHVLMKSITDDKFATSWFGLYHHKTKELTSVNAGHNYPLLFRNGSDTPEELKTGGSFLGAYEWDFQSETIKLAKDDVLVIYTDGITEALNEKNEQYETTRLENYIRNNRSKNAQDILLGLIEDVRKYTGKKEQSDDITVIILKIL